MADISTYPFLRHLRGSTTTHVSHVRNGQVVREGVGISFWFRPLSAALAEVPVDDRELPLLFHARTADFQDVTVQAAVTYRFARPEVVRERIDFSIDLATGQWRSTPLQQVAGLLTETAQQYALDTIATLPLQEVLVRGLAQVRETIGSGLADDERLAETGISVVTVRVVAIRPEPELEKALQTPTREEVQQAADRATYERRAIAVERERAIGENELQTRIELARREEQLVAQRGANQRLEAEGLAQASGITTKAQAEATRVQGVADGEAERARVAAYAEISEAVMIGLALKELAANLPKVESLVLTPELLSPILARLGRGSS